MVGPDKDGSLQEVKDFAKQLNVLNNVTFTGVLSKEKWHQISEDYDLFINTTTIDNTPVSIIEAMALGLPIVSTNVGGMPYLIDHNKNGILVDSDNENEMANAIIQLLHNPAKAIEFSQNARNKALSFDIELIKKEWLKILK
jgi:glycosyltransferase involved in cell wall biosynthesis